MLQTSVSLVVFVLNCFLVNVLLTLTLRCIAQDMAQAVRAAKSKSREAPAFSAVLPASTKSKL
jgi:hypothetical protein